jgi:hypothetical protein
VGGAFYFEVDCSSEATQHVFDPYSMGLVSVEELNEKLITTNHQTVSVPGLSGAECDTLTEVPEPFIRKVFTIQDMINVLGPRVPSAADAQKDFAIAFVMIVPKGGELNQRETDALNWIADKFPIAWYKASRGRSALNGIKPIDTTPPAIREVRGSTTRTSMTITWTTDKPAISAVIFTPEDTRTSLIFPGRVTMPPALATTHSVTIEASGQTLRLKSGSEYRVKIVSMDQNMNLATYPLVVCHHCTRRVPFH